MQPRQGQCAALVGLIEGVPSVAQLVALALLLLDVPPQAASVERTFSHFGWMQNKVMGN